MNLNTKRMRAAYPAVPDEVRARIRQTLAQIHREAGGRAPRRTARRLSFALTMLLAVALTAAAVATGARLGVFDFMARMFGASGVLPGAQELVQQNLGSLRLTHTDISVEEAVYDGGTLHVVYAVTLAEADVSPAGTDAQDTYGALERAMTADQVRTVCDSFFLNGVEYGMTGGSACDTAAGENDGELLCYLNIRLASAGIVPQGDFTVRLPVAGSADAGQTLDFTVKAAQTSRQPVVLHGGHETVTLLSAFASPVRTYVSVRVDMNANATAQETDEIFCDWAEAELVDAQGNALGNLLELLPRNVADGGSMEYSYTFAPVDAAELYLAPTFINEQGAWAVDMTRALPLQ